MAFLIGDSEGADQLMQKYLHEKGYEKVTVFVNGGDKVRCNEGGWPVHHCPSSAQTDRSRYAVSRPAGVGKKDVRIHTAPSMMRNCKTS